MLDPKHDFLNHGSFGARPRAVFDAQQRLRLEFETRPIDWLDRQRHVLIDSAKQAVGRFLGMQPANFGFVTNATGGINAVLRSLQFSPGDELLTTNHVYNAVRMTMRHIAARCEAKYVETPIPFPLKSSREVVEAVESALTPRTSILVIDHVTSPTAFIFPVREIVHACRQRGVLTLIDGAHAPGMLDLDIESIDADYYSANLHKWVCAPPGSAFLWVRRDRQQGIHPTTISHFLDESFENEFNWQGTRDITPWLCAADAIQWLEQLGWPEIRRHNHGLAMWTQTMLCSRWNVMPATPLDGSMIGSMATVALPAQERLRMKFAQHIDLRNVLYERFHIEAPIVDWGGAWWVRPCCQIYNRPQQYERLADAMLRLAREA